LRTDDSWLRLRRALDRAAGGEDYWEAKCTTSYARLLSFGQSVEVRLGTDERLESAQLQIRRWDLANPHPTLRTLDRIAQFLVAFGVRSPTRVALACSVGALLERGRLALAVPSDTDRRGATDLDVIAGDAWLAETSYLRVANVCDGGEWRLEIELFAHGRFRYGRWPEEARVPWAEELWWPHPTDGDDAPARIRRAVAASCTGEHEPASAAQELAAASEGIADGSLLGSFVSAARTLLRRWDGGELGTARALYELGALLDRGPDTAWPMTLREHIRSYRQWVPLEWAAEALADTGATPARDRRTAARQAITRLLLADNNEPARDEAVQTFLSELRALPRQVEGREDRGLGAYLAEARQTSEQFLEGLIVWEELVEVLQRDWIVLLDPHG
jgi:hypothetical protein